MGKSAVAKVMEAFSQGELPGTESPVRDQAEALMKLVAKRDDLKADLKKLNERVKEAESDLLSAMVTKKVGCIKVAGKKIECKPEFVLEVSRDFEAEQAEREAKAAKQARF